MRVRNAERGKQKIGIRWNNTNKCDAENVQRHAQNKRILARFTIRKLQIAQITTIPRILEIFALEYLVFCEISKLLPRFLISEKQEIEICSGYIKELSARMFFLI